VRKYEIDMKGSGRAKLFASDHEMGKAFSF